MTAQRKLSLAAVVKLCWRLVMSRYHGGAFQKDLSASWVVNILLHTTFCTLSQDYTAKTIPAIVIGMICMISPLSTISCCNSIIAARIYVTLWTMTENGLRGVVEKAHTTNRFGTIKHLIWTISNRLTNDWTSGWRQMLIGIEHYWSSAV